MSEAHREGDGFADRRTRPSDVSRDRLAKALRGDIADLQVQLEETILRSEAYLAAGLTDQASAVVDEQQELLSAMHRRLDDRVAAAAIEADAESILAASLERELSPPAAEMDDERVTPLRAARSAASVLVGAVAAVALMVMASSPPGPSTFAAAGVQDELDGRDVDDADATDSPTVATNDTRATADRDRVAGPNDLEVRRLFETPGPSDREPQPDPSDRSDLPVLQLQALVANVVSTVEGVAEAARDGWERALSERDGGAEQAEGERNDDAAPVADPVADDDGETSDDTSAAPPESDEPQASSDEAPDQADDADSTGDGDPDEDADTADEVSDRVGGAVADLDR